MEKHGHSFACFVITLPLSFEFHSVSVSVSVPVPVSVSVSVYLFCHLHILHIIQNKIRQGDTKKAVLIDMCLP